jgi:hypothetical protein
MSRGRRRCICVKTQDELLKADGEEEGADDMRTLK